MIYAALALWLFVIIFAGLGVYRLWTDIVRPGWVHWALLPGTIVSEMAYIFGCLITGGEVRRAKLIESPNKASADGATDASPGLKLVGPTVAATLAILACGGAIIAIGIALGQDVIAQFVDGEFASENLLPKALPTSWDAFWDHAQTQMQLLRRMFEMIVNLEWSNWRMPVFVYLSMCLSVRLAQVSRPIRSTLSAVAVISLAIAIVGALWQPLEEVMDKIWPLLTYVCSMLMFLLVITLIVRGGVALAGAVSAGKKGSGGSGRTRKKRKRRSSRDDDYDI